jgi:predicted DsbA family dithiol-disulfide isomerase
MSLVDSFLAGNLTEARKLIDERIKELFEQKLEIIKQRIVVEEAEKLGLDEANILKMGRTKLVRLRIRAGKVQRRMKFSTVPGYTIRGGKLVRMSSQERRRRKMGARRAKVKLRSKKSQILRKRKISLRKRKAMGVR